MDRAKNVALVFLWALLAARVFTLVWYLGYDKSDLATLALFAWLGGLVTCRLLEKVYSWGQTLYADWRAYQQN